MNIQEKELAKPPKRIGKLGTSPVFHLVTLGGLHLHVLGKGGSFEVISSGPHRAICQHISQKRHPEVEWTELSKGDYIDPQCFGPILPEYEALTDLLRAAK
ncbi:MAG: hypothetical protein NVS9B9_14870 [Ktedonobacteraceae bacterium]